ncbi:hypothetical protein UFOVP699_136 [uncultured Caudovirales phage]|uniref:Uncharacterized protein n=1 Tax=uncultured Caudovirales phage TaxID=2100421 RepID=A0A6J5NHZ8_9CAUD|nr:hypothetical protein UFOVP699_136 [uncultured Caudovirales phage]
MNFTDSERLDFLEKWEISIHDGSWFTLLTQHVQKDKYPTLRDFCDYGIDFEEMLDENFLDAMHWHTIPYHLQEKVIDIWKRLARPLNEPEKDYLQTSVDEYWESLSKSLTDSDK